MNTIRRLIYREILLTIALVALGFLGLFFFFDFVDELQYLGKNSSLIHIGNPADNTYQIRHALLYVVLLIPNHLYELFPISVLIGSIVVMARLAQSSEYTILRTSGLGPWRALKLLLGLGAWFVVFSFILGDYIAPASERGAQLFKARYQNKITVGQTGAWLKEKQTYPKMPNQPHHFVVNVQELSPDNEMRQVQLQEFNNKGLIISSTQASSGVFSKEGWLLHNVTRLEFDLPSSASHSPNSDRNSNMQAKVKRRTLEEFHWPTDISAEMISVALLKPERMATLDLFNYIRHLNANAQTAQRYEIEFWKKVFYPLSCLVMVILALPFAYLHFRAGGTTGYIFAGVMIGISFFLLNNVFGYIGNLRNWQPWLAAATPGLLYMAVSLGAFGWLVIRH